MKNQNQNKEVINPFKWVYIQLKTLFHLFKSPTFWKTVPRFLFVDLFWEGLATTVLFLFMIPAMRSGHVQVWQALLLSLIMGIASRFISMTYEKVNPMRGLFYKIQKKIKNNE